MEKTYLTPKDAEVTAYGLNIRLPTMAAWEEVDVNIARQKLPDAPWPENFVEMIRLWRNGGLVNFASGGQLRLGVSAGIMLRDKDRLVPLFNQFDEGHPTKPLHLTPPAGILENRDILSGIYNELGQEILIGQRHRGKILIGNWCHCNNGRRLQENWTKAYAESKRYDTSGITIPIHTFKDFPNKVNVYFGNDLIISCWVGFEPETGSIELIMPLWAVFPRNEIEVFCLDGERLPNRKWRNGLVIPVTERPALPLTSKAEIVWTQSRHFDKFIF